MAGSFQTSPPVLLSNASHPPGTPGQSPAKGSVGGTTLTYSADGGGRTPAELPRWARPCRRSAHFRKTQEKPLHFAGSSSYPDTNPKSGVRLGGSENLMEESRKELESKWLTTLLLLPLSVR